MNSTLKLILLILTAIQLCDILIAIILYFIYDYRREYISVIFLWLGQLLMFSMDGLLGTLTLKHIFFSFAFSGLSGIAIADIVAKLYSLPSLTKSSLISVLISIGLSLLFLLLGIKNFTVLSLVVAMGVTFPVFNSVIRAFQCKSEKRLLDKIFLGTLLVWGIHFLDYPFLRPKEDEIFAIFGFSFALFLTYLSSILVPVILNRFIYGQLNYGLQSELAEQQDRLKRTQSALVAKENLARMGALSAGLAHEVKNPINLIQNSAVALKQIVSNLEGVEKQNLTKFSDLIIDHSERADKTIKSILEQSSTERSDSSVEDVNELILEVNRLVRHNRSKGVDFLFERGKLKPIKLYRVEFVRMMINLFDNAYKAINAKKYSEQQPEIRIETSQNEEKTFITITDNGCGIEKDHLDRIFEPFFSTKMDGQGTGLGMAMVREIVRLHNGQISLQSVQGEYTKVRLEFDNQRE